MRQTFDRIYTLSRLGASLSLIAILCLVVAQMVSRWLGVLFPGGANYAGYAMAAASFLALADTFRHNEHIRVGMVIERSGRWRRGFEIWCYTVGAVIALFFAWYAVETPFLSHKINDVSQGQDGTPLWIPQLAMAAGAVLLAIAMLDSLLSILFRDGLGVDAPTKPMLQDALKSIKPRLMLFALSALVIYAAVTLMTGFDRDAVGLKIGVFLFVLFFLLGSGLWVGLALMGVAYMGMIGFTPRNPGSSMSITVWTSASSWTLTSLPLFIWMGEILYRTRLSEDMFKGLAPWLARFPGGLLHSNVVGCTVFAAVSGSSAATLTTVGKMSIPELRKRGYPEFMIVGTLAGAATLGLMIPPSLTLIVYGVTVQQSVTSLFMAGVIPGIVLATMFMAYIAIWSMIRKDQAPDPEPDTTFTEKLRTSTLLIPVIALIAIVIGSMYLGIATATEAAAFGVIGALVLAAMQGSLDWEAFRQSLTGATRTSAMIALILMGASFLTLAMGFTGVPRALAEVISAWNLSPVALIAALTVFYIIIGMFLDGISAVVLTMAIIEPMIRAAGIDLIWFGIFIVVVVEMAQITPPVGFNLFVLQGMTRHDMSYIARTAIPMFLIMVVMVGILVAFPGLATWLPETVQARQ
ncbi:tripartite ATP-independent transporter DctM subunit [Sagittula marina]|uniref:Tripartite ATP-independent transporter DctM subunit n=2 Tax=Sagittula marina TaxID=943940 RepID=A0A7W6GTV5_9RHOB|nr:tripartite ATP-independent transporter DctM subunit [Sagittula marina]